MVIEIILYGNFASSNRWPFKALYKSVVTHSQSQKAKSVNIHLQLTPDCHHEMPHKDIIQATQNTPWQIKVINEKKKNHKNFELLFFKQLTYESKGHPAPIKSSYQPDKI